MQKAVNNSLPRLCKSVDGIGQFELFAGCSRGVFGEQAVHINSLSVRGFRVSCSQFIERTKRAAEVERLSCLFQYNPK